MPDTKAIYPDLANKIIAVTGGASGIGAAIVDAFHYQDSQVLFFDIDTVAGNELAGRLGDNVSFIPVDLSNSDALAAAFSKASKTVGVIDVLINNAANDERHEFLDVTPEFWNQRLAVNLDHVFFASQAVAPAMLAKGSGSIINMSSIAWKIGLENAAAYVTAKSAIVGLTHALARELGPGGVRVNCLLPGAVTTQRQLDNWLPVDVQKEVLRKQCLKNLIEPDDIANMVLVLASDVSRAVTNQTLVVDAGWT